MEDTKMSSSPPPSPNDDASMRSDDASEARPKKSRKKRRSEERGDGSTKFAEGKKAKKRSKEAKEGKERTKKEKGHKSKQHAQQIAVQDQMRRALEDDRYSAVGSIVSDTDSDDDDDRLEKSDVRAAMRKRLWMMERKRQTSNVAAAADKGDSSETEVASVRSGSSRRGGRKKKRKKNKRSKESDDGVSSGTSEDEAAGEKLSGTADTTDGIYEEGSIFGPTTGSSHATWVECDKCKKWRRLRGVVDETKLPSRWYCSMNKNDPERARCSAPEEEYSETAKPEEDAADARARKHLRVWVRRLRCQEAFRDAKRPMTRGGNKRSTSAGTKEPYEWIRCCSCGKWRACLRFMDKSQVLDRNNEWYCVMNTWDEKMASCAAPQENLPAMGCPPWVMQDEN